MVFECAACHKPFGVRIGQSTPPSATNEAADTEAATPAFSGNIVVIENVFHYRQQLPLHLGVNTIGRYMKGSKTTVAIETDDPSMDMLHCVLTVNRKKDGTLQYILRDGPSNTGTFVGDELLADRERRVITPGTLFTIGATSIILSADEQGSATAGE